MIEFITSLFKKDPPPDPVIKKHNVGKTIATIKLHVPYAGRDTFTLTFIGTVSEDWSWDGGGINYIDSAVDSNAVFRSWLNNIVRFVAVGGGIYIPVQDIQAITTERIDYVIETERKE